jgi:hypothetical protein
MIATGARTTIYRSIPSLTRALTRAPPSRQLAAGFHDASALLRNRDRDISTRPIAFRPFSSTTKGTVSDGVPSANEVQQKAVGSVTKKLRVLDMNVVKQILEGKDSNCVVVPNVSSFSDFRLAFPLLSPSYRASQRRC